MRRFWKLRWCDRLLLAEALVLLVFARVAIAMLPFRAVAGLASRCWNTPVPAPMLRGEAIRRVRWAVASISRRAPFRAVCFQQGLAAQIMLRRRGIPSLLYYGAVLDRTLHLSSHVWVRDGETDVTGCAEAPRFTVLARFPAAGASA